MKFLNSIDKKINSFYSRKNKLIETIDIYPSLIARYSKKGSNNIKNQFNIFH